MGKHSFKFLYIIGIIVAVIFLVSLGLYVMQNYEDFASKTEDAVNVDEANDFNLMWSTYKGKQKGTNVKIMLQKVVQTAEANSNDADKLLDIAYKIRASDEFTIINSTREENNIKDIEVLMQELDVKHYYTIEFVSNRKTDQITGIIIKYSEKDKIDFVPNEN